jgi:CBS domain-containing protein
MTEIRDVMRKDVVTVDEETSVLEAAKLMGEKHLGSVVVTNDGKPTGIFTERDFLSKVILEGHELGDVSVGSYASKPLITISPNFHLKEAASIMADMKVKRLVVMDNEKLVGIFTASDLAVALAGETD